MNNIIDQQKQQEETILELIREGNTYAQIAKIMQISITAVTKMINRMDYKKVEEAKNEANKRREEKLLELIREGKTYAQMAEIMGVTPDTINKWISKIDPQKVEKVRNEVKQKREEKILKLIEDRNSYEKIAEIMQVSISTINKWVSKMDASKVKEARNKAKEKAKKVRKKSKQKEEENKTQKTQETQENKIVNIYYKQLKQKLKEHTITQNEIEDYRDYLDDKYNKIELKEVILMSNMYIKTKRANQAIIYLKLLIENEDMEYLGKEKLIEAKKEAEKIGRVQKARVLIKENKSTSYIVEITGLNETEVIKIRNQIQENQTSLAR